MTEHRPDPDYGKPEHPVAHKVVKEAVKDEIKEKAFADEKAALDKTKLLNDMARILKVYDGESNVPHHHEYWAMLTDYRSKVNNA